MVGKKVIGVLLMSAVVVSASAYGYTKVFAVTPKSNVVVLNYAAPKNEEKPVSFKINSLHNLESLDWLSDNEILISNKKGDLESPDSKQDIMYFSIYNIDTGKTKDYKNVNAGEFISVSPDKKYVLYQEPKYIPKIESSEWSNDINSGKLFNYSIKLLNLITGETTDLKTEYKNKETNYEWVDNDKLLMFYPNENEKWVIQDISGKIYKSGNFKEPSKDYMSWSAHTLDMKFSNDTATGYITLEQWDPSVAGVTLKSTYYMIDISTNQTKKIYRSEGSGNYTVQNNVILTGDYSKDPKPTTKIDYFDKSGAKKGEYLYDGIMDVDTCSISKDGSKAAITQHMPLSKNVTVNIIDLKTGKINKINETDSMLNSIGSNLKWNNDGTAFMFNVSNRKLNLQDTYFVKIQ